PRPDSMKPVGQPARGREMAARDAVKRVPEITRNHCPNSAKCAESEGRMSSKYGFGGGIELPKVETRNPRMVPDQGVLNDAVTAGSALGFVSREPAAKRKPGPKRREPQDKVSIPGPKRVIDEFRAFCTEQNVTLWEGLNMLLQGRGH
ncbi:hypothetical protein, partial [Roseinatronobacter alkalisoli]